MSGIDKSVACNELKKYGWVEIEKNMLVPPDSLWNDKPNSFYIYDAIELHRLLKKIKNTNKGD